jgi:ubiquinone/menaquinone biosynthesis C-methylase UbiE
MPKLNDQNFYYQDFRGRLLGNKAREQLIMGEIAGLGRQDFFLEVGCAQGHFVGKARRFSKNAFGGEYELGKMPAARKEFPGCHFLGINAEALPFKSGSFDFVLCTEVLEHVPDWESAFKELLRVSRKNVLVTVPLEKGYFWRAISRVRGMDSRGHLHKLDSRELEKRLGKGWRVLKKEIVSTPSPHLNRLIGRMANEKLGLYTLLLLEKARQN